MLSELCPKKQALLDLIASGLASQLFQGGTKPLWITDRRLIE
jgi:hypothetical protein